MQTSSTSILIGIALTQTALADSHWRCTDGDYLTAECWDDGIPTNPGEFGDIDWDNFGTPYTVELTINGGTGGIQLGHPDARWLMNGVTFNPAFYFNTVIGTLTTIIDGGFIGQTGVLTNGGTIIFDGNCQVDLQDLVQNNVMILRDEGTLTVTNGFTNHGILSFEPITLGSPEDTRLQINNGWLTNTGGIVLNIPGSPNGTVSVDANIDNQGTIEANADANFDGTGTTFLNNSTTQVLDGGSLTLGPVFVDNNTSIDVLGNNARLVMQGATFDNTGGLIDVTGSNARFQIDAFDSTLSGGTVRTTGNALFEILRDLSGSVTRTLEDFTNDGTMQINGPNHVRLGGVINNTGDINVLGTAFNDITLNLNRNLTISGGTVSLLDIENTVTTTSGTPHVLTLDNTTLRGSGHVGDDTLCIVNAGELIADQAEPLEIDPDNTTGLDNTAGLIAARLGGTARLLDGTFDNTGSSIRAEDDGTVQLNGATIVNGTLETAGTGTVEAPAFNFISTLQDVTLNGTLNALQNQNGLILRNHMTLNGTLNLLATPSVFGKCDLLIDNDTTITGTGSIGLSNGRRNRLAATAGASPTPTLTLTIAEIRGGGAIGTDSLTIINHTPIIVDQPENMVIDPDDTGGFTNTSTLAARDGSTLTLQSGPFDNTGGVIRAEDNSSVAITDVTITGGILDTTGTGVIQSLAQNTACTINSAQLTGRMDLQQNHAGLTLQALFTIDGTLNMLAADNSFGNCNISIDGDTTIDGAGTMELSNSPNNRIGAASGNPTPPILTLELASLTGGGQIGRDQLSIINRADITANQPFDLIIDPVNSGSMLNEGTLLATSGATLLIEDGPFDNMGNVTIDAGAALERCTDPYAQSAGATIVNGMLDASDGNLQLNGGTLGGSGTVLAHINVQSAAIAPGPAAAASGTLTIDGDLFQNPGANTRIEIGGLTPGVDHDRIDITGAATLDGTLHIAQLNGFAPQATDEFIIIAAATITGTFTTVDTSAFPGFDGTVTYTPTDVRLSLVPTCPGDADGSGTVNFDDLNAVLANWNQSVPAGTGGDVTGDGQVNFDDLNLVLANWNAVC